MNSYNGWSNKETWAAALHINNVEFLYTLCKGWDAKEMAEVMNHALSPPNPFDGVMVSLAREVGDISKINWDEIAESLVQS